MEKRVKKGFTLVEVVAALAILTSSIAIIYQVFNFSGTVWTKEKNNISLVSYSQTIAETLKGSGKDHLTDIYAKSPTSYIYFDSVSDAKSVCSSYDMGNFTTILGSEDIYSKNIRNNIYGAQIVITNLSLSTTNYAVYHYYKVDIKVWNLNKLQTAPTQEISTVATFYIT